MIKKLSLISLVLAATLAFGACGQVMQIVDAAKDAAANGINDLDPSIGDALDQLADAPNDQMNETDKYNDYIRASGSLSGRMVTCLERYESQIGLGEEYKVNKKKFSKTLNSIDFIRDDLQKALDNAGLAPKFDVIDDRFLVLGPAALTLLDALNDAYTYYETKGYVDDDFAKGEELHKRIIAAYAVYSPLYEAFRTDFDAFTRAHVLKEIDRFKEEGSMVLYWSNVYILDANALIEYLDTLEVKKNAVPVDPEKYKKLYDQLAKDLEEFQKYAADEQRIKDEGIDMMFSLFKSDVGDFKSAAAKIMQNLNEKDKVSVDTANDLFSAYNSMIDAYNRII